MKYKGDSNPYNVDAVWEVRLRPEIIEDIRTAASHYKTTMSWIVRWCTFRLFLRKKISLDKLHNIAQELRERNQPKPMSAGELHRLRVCLYGGDERIFLELKYRFGLTTTMLVRIALQLYLKYLLDKAESWRNVFFYGLKFFSQTKALYSRRVIVPQVDFHIHKFFHYSDYWDIPPGKMPNFIRV